MRTARAERLAAELRAARSWPSRHDAHVSVRQDGRARPPRELAEAARGTGRRRALSSGLRHDHGLDDRGPPRRPSRRWQSPRRTGRRGRPVSPRCSLPSSRPLAARRHAPTRKRSTARARWRAPDARARAFSCAWDSSAWPFARGDAIGHGELCGDMAARRAEVRGFPVLRRRPARLAGPHRAPLATGGRGLCRGLVGLAEGQATHGDGRRLDEGRGRLAEGREAVDDLLQRCATSRRWTFMKKQSSPVMR